MENLKFSIQHIWIGMVARVVQIVLCLSMRTSSIFISQHVATCCNRVGKRVQHVAPNNIGGGGGKLLRSVAFKCYRLAGACKCLANHVVICCVELLLPFGRGSTYIWCTHLLYSNSRRSFVFDWEFKRLHVMRKLPHRMLMWLKKFVVLKLVKSVFTFD